MPMLFLCVLSLINEAVSPILILWFVFLGISQYDIVVSYCYIHYCVVGDETSEREFCIKYDDQLLGVSIVCIRGGAENYAMWLYELLVNTSSFVTAPSNWNSAIVFRTSPF